MFLYSLTPEIDDTHLCDKNSTPGTSQISRDDPETQILEQSWLGTYTLPMAFWTYEACLPTPDPSWFLLHIKCLTDSRLVPMRRPKMLSLILRLILSRNLKITLDFGTSIHLSAGGSNSVYFALLIR